MKISKHTVPTNTMVKDLIDKHYSSLLRYCCFLAKNNWDGEDLTQDTIIKASLKYEYKEVSSALLKKIAYHQWIDLVRKREREWIGNTNEEAETVVNTDSTFDTVSYLTNHLTPKQAIYFLLKEAFGYQTKEIANLLKTTETAVKSSLHRAKARLSKDESFHTVNPFWDAIDKEGLIDLLQEALKEEDPSVLLEQLPQYPSILEVPSVFRSSVPSSSHHFYARAA